MSPDRDDDPGGSSPTPQETRTLGRAGDSGDRGGRDTKSPPPGARLGHFRIEQPIGEGGAGRVFIAEDLDIPGRRVAIKILRAGGLTPDLEALRREASALAALRHPHILVVHEIGASEWGPYLVTELMESGSLAARLRYGPLAERAGLRLAHGVASALAAAHARGLLHRDIKPANLLLGKDDGAVKVADFGLVWRRVDPRTGGDAGAGDIATIPAASASGTRPGPISGDEQALNRGAIESAGTPQYMAPEVLEGHPPDAAADQFAFGVTLCELLTGQRPFEGRDWDTKVVSGAARIPAGMARDVEAIVRRAIARRPADRFASMSGVVAALEAVREHRDPRRRRLAWTVGGSAALFVLLVGGWGLLRMRQGEKARAIYATGVVALKRGDHDSARRAFLEAHATDRSYLQACAGLGQLAATESNPAWAITILEECASTFPEAAEVRYNLGAALQRTGRADAAERELRLAVRLAGRGEMRPMALNDLAMSLVESGRADEAIALLEPERPFRTAEVQGASLSRTLGLAYAAAGAPREAARLLREALAGPLTAAQQRAALVALGGALEKTGDDAGALEAYSRALLAGGADDDPDAAAARAGLARLQP